MWYFNDHCGNSHSSPGLAEASWGGTSWDGAPSARCRVCFPSAQRTLARQRDGTRCIFPSGMMYARSMATLARIRLTSLLAVSCRDISIAGKGDGLDGDASGLWTEMAGIIGQVEPPFVLVENSPMLTSRGFTEYNRLWPRWVRWKTWSCGSFRRRRLSWPRSYLDLAHHFSLA